MHDFYVCGQTMSGEGSSSYFSNRAQEAKTWEKIKHLKTIEFMQTSTQSILGSLVRKLQITESKSIKIHRIIKMLENSKDSIWKIPALRLRGFFAVSQDMLAVFSAYTLLLFICILFFTCISSSSHS